jgi:hypothetical protein
MAIPFATIAARALPLLGGFKQGVSRLGSGPGQILGYVAAGELVKHTVVNPALGATGLYYRPGPAAGAAPAPAAGAAPGLARQQDFLYGEQPGLFGMAYLPWQQQQGFMDRQLNSQSATAKGWQDAARYQAGVGAAAQARQSQALEQMADYYSGRQLSGTIDSNRTMGGIARDQNFTQRYLGGIQQDLGRRQIAGQVRIADFTTARQLAGLQDTNRAALAGLQDTNRSKVRIADLTSARQLNAVYDTNTRDIRVAEIGANRDRYLADRNVEVARWGGAAQRSAVFGNIMMGAR